MSQEHDIKGMKLKGMKQGNGINGIKSKGYKWIESKGQGYREDISLMFYCVICVLEIEWDS